MKNIVCLFIFFIFLNISGQPSDSMFISKILYSALTNRSAYNNLKYLCDSAKGRLLGTEASLKALAYFKSKINELNADTCFFQEYTTPAWRHISTSASIKESGTEIKLHALALGPSVATETSGVEADVIEVSGIEELNRLERKNVEGKIVFYNKIFNNTYINPSDAYRDAVKVRLYGAPEAARLGAKAAVIRSLTAQIDTFPHTGKTVYFDSIVKIPIVALSAQDADLLSKKLKEGRNLKLKLNVDVEKVEKVTTYNLIADFKGAEKPDEYILIGAHIDSWYNTSGAHDDGAGCVQVVDIIRIFRDLNYQNKRSVRVVLFMDEELFQTGADAYAFYSKENKIKYCAAIESDAGGFSPRSFAIDGSESVFSKISSFQLLLKPYGIYYIYKGGTDVDIERLKQFNVPLIGNKPDVQRYFDYHHSSSDTFDKVNFRELQLGTCTLAGLVYLIDKYGLSSK